MSTFFCKLASVLLVFQMFLLIEGRVRLVGTGIFPSLVISTSDGKEFYFDESLFDAFRSYQNQTIKIKAEVKNRELELADGSKKFSIPTLYKASVIKD